MFDAEWYIIAVMVAAVLAGAAAIFWPDRPEHTGGQANGRRNAD